jgi:hypothetical protein
MTTFGGAAPPPGASTSGGEDTRPSVANISGDVRQAAYAVRGEIVQHAQELAARLSSKPGSLPFERVVYCNIGNPQQLGQTPITYFRYAKHRLWWERQDQAAVLGPLCFTPPSPRGLTHAVPPVFFVTHTRL